MIIIVKRGRRTLTTTRERNENEKFLNSVERSKSIKKVFQEANNMLKKLNHIKQSLS
jgi:hypothetical protein